KRAFIKCDPGSAGIAAVRAGTEADDHVSAAIPGGVLQGEKEPAGWRRVVAVIGAAPGVDVDHPIGRDHHLPGVTDVVREHRCAKARRQRDPAIVAWTALCGRRGRAARVLRSRWRGREQQPEDANADSGAPRHPTADQKRFSHHVHNVCRLAHCLCLVGNALDPSCSRLIHLAASWRMYAKLTCNWLRTVSKTSP